MHELQSSYSIKNLEYLRVECHFSFGMLKKILLFDNIGPRIFSCGEIILV